MTRGLVLGGGGVVGIAWETGVLLGLADGGADVLDADLFVGTSAGATVGAQVTSGVPLPELYSRQLGPPDASGEIPVQLDGWRSRRRSPTRCARRPRHARDALRSPP